LSEHATETAEAAQRPTVQRGIEAAAADTPTHRAGIAPLQAVDRGLS